MFVTGISNRLNNDKFLFFYEFDKVKFSDVLEETCRLSDKFQINVAILESSPNNYHLISFDVLTHEQVKIICYDIRLDSDFVHLDLQKLLGNRYEDNCLRIGKKFNKNTPKFMCWVHPKTQDNYISINHLYMYNSFCGVPLYPIPEPLKLDYRVYFVVYKTGTPRKKWIGGCRRKVHDKYTNQKKRKTKKSQHKETL